MGFWADLKVLLTEALVRILNLRSKIIHIVWHEPINNINIYTKKFKY